MGTRVAGLDLLRAAAITCVLLSHGLPFLYSHAPVLTYFGHLGSMGVDLFFVLSGFLIGGILWRIGPRLCSARVLGDFWVRRWLRTLPNYYVFFFLTLALSVWLYRQPLDVPQALRVGLFVQNLTWLGHGVFPESWTLAIEEWFYLLTPLALWAGLQLTNRFRLVWWTVVAAMLVLPLVARAMQPVPSAWGTEIRMPVFLRLDALAYGVAAAALRDQFPVGWRRLGGIGLAVGLPLVLGAYVLLYRLNLDHSWFAHTLLFNLISVGFVLLLPWAAEKKTFGNGLGERAIRRVALWSYSLYLCNFGLHVFVVRTWGATLERSLPLALAAFIGFWLAAFLIAAAAYRFIERPFMEWRDRMKPARGRPV